MRGREEWWSAKFTLLALPPRSHLANLATAFLHGRPGYKAHADTRLQLALNRLPHGSARILDDPSSHILAVTEKIHALESNLRRLGMIN